MKFFSNFLLQINWTDIEYSVDEFGRTMYSFPIHIRILIGVIILFLLVILILLGIIMSSRIYKTRLSNKKTAIRLKYQPVFRQLLFDDSLTQEKVLAVFSKDDLTDNFHRSLIIEEIIHLHENFTGETAERLEEIYRHAGFDRDSQLKLKSKRWYIIAKGMKELAIMNVRSSTKEISSFINSKNEILRMETRIALMKLSDSNPLAFLSNEKEHISDWDSANIYNMLSKMPEKSIPDFSQWLNSTNKDVKVFCIQMIGRFKQNESIDSLISLLQSDDERIKITVVKALRMLSARSSEDELLKIFNKESIAVKNEILLTIEAVGTNRSLPLLEKIVRQPIEDFPVSIQAVRAILRIDPSGNNLIETIFNQAGPQLQLIIRHARDRRL